MLITITLRNRRPTESNTVAVMRSCNINYLTWASCLTSGALSIQILRHKSLAVVIAIESLKESLLLSANFYSIGINKSFYYFASF